MTTSAQVLRHRAAGDRPPGPPDVAGWHAMPAPCVLILSAAIGEGHDLPARFLAAGLETAGARARVEDGLNAMGPFLEGLALSGSPFASRWGGLLFDLEYV
jgi:hypothetical protein